MLFPKICSEKNFVIDQSKKVQAVNIFIVFILSADEIKFKKWIKFLLSLKNIFLEEICIFTIKYLYFRIPGFSEVCEQRDDDIAGELHVGWRHFNVVSPQTAEDVLQLVPLRHSHVNLGSYD